MKTNVPGRPESAHREEPTHCREFGVSHSTIRLQKRLNSMPRRLVLGALCFLVGCVASHGALLAQSAAVSESALKAGFGVMEITPVGPTPMAG